MSGYYHPINLNGTLIGGNVFLAPMAGYTDRAFRQICTESGADLCYSEMVSMEGLIRKGEKTLALLARFPGERNLAVQLFGANPRSAAESVRILTEYAPVFIDLNCGCPVPKVVRSGAGSALMKTPREIYRIIYAMTRASDIPISVKIRTGWDKTNQNYLEAARAAEEGGAAMIAMHGRTRSQGYAGTADWDLIADLKANTALPVFGSGDLFSADDALAMLTHTGCDGIMPARGAVGNPFLFEQIKSLLIDGVAPHSVPLERRVEMIRRHLRRSIAYIGERAACREMKKQCCAYTKGLRGGSEFRNAIVHASCADDYYRALDTFLARSTGSDAPA